MNGNSFLTPKMTAILHLLWYLESYFEIEGGWPIFPASRVRRPAGALDQIGAPAAVRRNRLRPAEVQTRMGYTHTVSSDERGIADELGRILHATARNEQEEWPAGSPLNLMIQSYEVGCRGEPARSW
jgi:hypothetical protein